MEIDVVPVNRRVAGLKHSTDLLNASQRVRNHVNRFLTGKSKEREINEGSKRERERGKEEKGTMRRAEHQSREERTLEEEREKGAQNMSGKKTRERETK